MKIPRGPVCPSRTPGINGCYKSAKIISTNYINELYGNQGILKSAIVPYQPSLFNNIYSAALLTPIWRKGGILLIEGILFLKWVVYYEAATGKT
jgi:hypothetical protein